MDIYFYRIGLNGEKEIIKVDTAGVQWLLGAGEKDLGYLAWVAEGNEAQTWE